MAEVVLVRQRIEPGETDRLREWYAELADREDEVVATLEHEAVYTETAFVETTENGDYLYGYMEADDLEAADAAGDAEEYDVDEEHHAVLEKALTGDREVIEPIGHFTNPNRP